MGGRGASSSTADTSYQGTNTGSGKASGKGLDWSSPDAFRKIEEYIAKYPASGSDSQALGQIRNITGPDSTVTIYRATPGGQINKGDWIFLSFEYADRWTRTAFGRSKPGFKVIQGQVKARDIDWTGKNLEFIYTGKKAVK